MRIREWEQYAYYTIKNCCGKKEEKKRDDRIELKKKCATNGEKKNNKYFYELLKCMHLPFLSNIFYILISLYVTTTTLRWRSSKGEKAMRIRKLYVNDAVVTIIFPLYILPRCFIWKKIPSVILHAHKKNFIL